ncbi:transposase family protein [Microcoleus sp. BR0-C5]|uniref:transposase family protein n=1 Tax=Microcoleus sp. BR0-C5 TaxID=2818713 RepID=UPI002FD00F07
MSQLAIVEAFRTLPDTRRTAGQRHTQALCLALFTLSVTAGNRGFLAIGDWLGAYHDELVALFAPPCMTLTILQHHSADTVAARLPGLLGLFISIFRY